jgi:Ca2+-binding RTX toxin-like protein
VIVGSSLNDTINAGGGDDLVCGLGGDDGQINGGLGEDKLDGGAGNDRLRGDVSFPPGSGLAAVGGDDDVLYGGSGDDRLVGDSSGKFASGGGHDRPRAMTAWWGTARASLHPAAGTTACSAATVTTT